MYLNLDYSSYECQNKMPFGEQKVLSMINKHTKNLEPTCYTFPGIIYAMCNVLKGTPGTMNILCNYVSDVNFTN